MTESEKSNPPTSALEAHAAAATEDEPTASAAREAVAATAPGSTPQPPIGERTVTHGFCRGPDMQGPLLFSINVPQGN